MSQIEIKKIVKETTTITVYRYLYDLILSGHFQPGEWIRERQIKDWLEVSSTPIREALSMLVQDRILESVPHRGVRIKIITSKEIEDLYELRVELESLAVELAAKRGIASQFKKMEELLYEVEEKEKSANYQDSLNYNNQFHEMIVEASGNNALKNVLFQVFSESNLIRMLSWKENRTRSSLTLEQHKLILEAIMARDPQLARKRIQEHIWDTVKLVLETYKK